MKKLVLFCFLSCFCILGEFSDSEVFEEGIHFYDGVEIKSSFNVMFSGEYTLSILFDKRKLQEESIIDDYFGLLACKDTERLSPCKQIESFDVFVSKYSGGIKEDYFLSEKNLCCGWESKSFRSAGISDLYLYSGHNEINIKFFGDMEPLNSYNPKLVIAPGVGAKSYSSQSAMWVSWAGSISFYIVIFAVLIFLYEIVVRIAG